MDYITIIQGDDTNFLEDQFVVVNFNTSIDLSGFTATFTLGDVTLTYGNLSGKTFEIILSNEITSNLKIGKQYGELKLIDNSNRIRTVSSVIPFIVKKGVDETITFVNSSLNVSMNINDTVIDIYVETSGISKTEALRILANCRDAEQASSNYSNTAQNAMIAVNQSLDKFYSDYETISDLMYDSITTYNQNITNINQLSVTKVANIEQVSSEKISGIEQTASQKVSAITSLGATQLTNIEDLSDEKVALIEATATQKLADATAQADRAEDAADYVEDALANASDSDLTKLSSTGLDKINQSKALETGSVSNYASVYNKILQYKNAANSSGVDIIEQNYVIPDYYGLIDVELTVNNNGITSGLYDSNNYVIVNNVSIPNTAQTTFNIHIETILRSGFNQNTSAIGATTTNALMLQLQPSGRLMAYMYANDNNTKMMQSDVITGMSIGDRLIIDLGFNSEDSFYIKGSCNGVNVKATENISTAWIREAVSAFWYGKCSWSGNCYMEVDLLHSYFDINGTRTRALAQIPYSLSPTGSKITTSDYLDFVQELYAKKGVAPYYTINTTNQTFTLPMGEVYGMINKKADLDLSNTNPSNNFIASIIENFAPDVANMESVYNVPSSSSQYYAPCAGWYVIAADASARRYLYLNNVQTPYSIGGSGQPSVSVFLGTNDRVYWSGGMSNVYYHKFIPVKGCHHIKTTTDIFDDLLG